VEDFIFTFEHLDFIMGGMLDAFFQDCFINGIKYEIRAHVLMELPYNWLEATQCAKEAQQFVSSHTRRPSFIPHPKPTNLSPPKNPLKIHKLTRE
jgi:hypothetical protein